MEYIVPIIVGLLTQFLNFIEIWLLMKKSQRKSAFETILLSLAFADFLVGTGTLLLGILHLLYLLPSTNKSDMLSITAENMTVLGITASLIHVYLITIERFAAVYFPIYHHVFVSKRQNSRITIALMWIISAALDIVCFFKFQIYFITALVGISLLMGLLVVIYGLIARKIVLNNRMRQQNHSGQSQVHGRKDKIQQLVVINSGLIVACFTLCSSPWMISAVVKLFNGQTIERTQTPDGALLYHLFVVNSLLDPGIYFLVSYYRKRKGV